MRRTLALFYLCASIAPAAEVQGITGPVDTELTGPAMQAAAQQKPAPDHRAEFSVSYFGGLNPSRGGSNMNITDAFLSVPVYHGNCSFGEDSIPGKCSGELSLLGRYTRLEGDIHGDLYCFGLNASADTMLNPYTKVLVGVSPIFCGDTDLFNGRNLYMNFYGGLAGALSVNFQYMIGLVFTPQNSLAPVLPMVHITWKYAPDWELRVRRMRFSTVNTSVPGLEWGPFAEFNGGIWTLRRDGETQRFRMTHLVLGMGARYEVKRESYSVTGLLDAGVPVYGSYRLYDRHGHRDVERSHSNGGWFVRAGLEVTF
ncbi:MAG: DUF6268 family outer membrane beta-barrel protein [Akkermansia sp.]